MFIPINWALSYSTWKSFVEHHFFRGTNPYHIFNLHTHANNGNITAIEFLRRIYQDLETIPTMTTDAGTAPDPITSEAFEIRHLIPQKHFASDVVWMVDVIHFMW